MTPSPLQISELRFRLQNNGRYESIEILREVLELGQGASELTPDLIEAMRKGVCLPSRYLVPIIATLKSNALLTAAMNYYGDGYFSTGDKCTLLVAGFLKFQSDLLQELWKCFENDAEPLRSEIVKGLISSGTSGALEMLRVIEYRTASRVPELEMISDPQEFTEHLLKGEHAQSRKEFLAKVRTAIKSVDSRPDPEAPVEEQTATPAILGSPVAEIIKNEEADNVEFKAAFQADLASKRDDKLQHANLKTIAGFGNNKGGTLLIGIEPNGNPVGLGRDYSLLKGKRDHFERNLRQILHTDFGAGVTAQKIEIRFPKVQGIEICQIKVSPFDKAVFLNNEFFVRDGNATRPVQGEDLADYLKSRFG